MFFVFECVDECLAAHSSTQDMLAGCRAKVTITTGSGMISMGVGDHGMRYWSPRVDIKISCRAEQAVGSDFSRRAAR